MVATPIQSSAPSISLASLRDALASLKSAEPERGCRWDRAASIVALRAITAGVAGWWVGSESDPRTEYYVCLDRHGRHLCTCPDYRERGGPCKHALAVRLLVACEAREEAPAPIPFPTATLDPDAP